MVPMHQSRSEEIGNALIENVIQNIVCLTLLQWIKAVPHVFTHELFI